MKTKMKIKTRFTWHNTTKRFSAQPQKYFEPENLKDLQDIILEAEAKGIRVRAVGSGHSFSDVALTNGYLINPKKLNRQITIPPSWLPPDQRFRHKNLVYVEAGIKLQDFNKQMDERNLCVENMGAVDEQTLAGAISTGTHGTGIGLPAMSGMVRSIVMVSKGGTIYRIEPSAGLFDPEKYNEPGITLVQDDKWFNAALVSLGCLGIIYAYVVELKPMYWLEESKELTTWSALKPKLENDLDHFLRTDKVGNPIRAISILVNPYPNKDGEHSCLINRHKEVAEPPKHRSWNERFRNLWSITLGGVFPFSYLFYRGTRVLNARFPGQMPGLIERSLKLLEDKVFINKGHKVMYAGAEYIKLKAFDAEYAFDVQNNARGFIHSVEQVMAKAKALAEASQLFQTSPMGLRFVKASTASLTPESGRDVCYVDTPVLLGTKGANAILDAYQDVFIQNGGVPHWGKVNNRFEGKQKLLKQHYTQLAEWEAVFHELNPNGTFSNNFSDRFGLGKLVYSEKPLEV